MLLLASIAVSRVSASSLTLNVSITTVNGAESSTAVTVAFIGSLIACVLLLAHILHMRASQRAPSRKANAAWADALRGEGEAEAEAGAELSAVVDHGTSNSAFASPTESRVARALARVRSHNGMAGSGFLSAQSPMPSMPSALPPRGVVCTSPLHRTPNSLGRAGAGKSSDYVNQEHIQASFTWRTTQHERARAFSR